MKILKLTFLALVCSSFGFAQPPGSGWTLRFEDNFNGTAIDAGKWTVRTNYPVFKDWAVVVNGGSLKLLNVVNSVGTSFGGWISSKQQFGDGQTFGKYGYYEARLRIDAPANGQIWPTFWIWGNRVNNVPTTEFDLMEYSGFSARDNNNKATTSHHYRGKVNLPPENSSRTHTFGDNNRNAFEYHRWGMLWTPTEVTFYYDGVPYLSSNHPEDAAAEVNPLRLIFSSSPHVIDTPSNGDPEQPDNPVPANVPTPGVPLPSLQVDWVRFWNGGTAGGGGSSPVVTMRKGNATNFCIDGADGGGNGQNVRLWTYYNHVNQQWIEIDRGGGYFTYKKRNTNFCLDGGNGGANGQNVYLWTCSGNNQNQHWRKVDVGGGKFRLEKRNAPAYSIDGNNGGANGQNVYLWSSSNGNPNQHWQFTNVGSANARVADRDTELQEPVGVPAVEQEPVVIYPNPLTGNQLNLRVDLQGRNRLGLRVFDASGRKLYENFLGEYSGGAHTLEFGRDELKINGKGLFILEVRINDRYERRKVILD